MHDTNPTRLDPWAASSLLQKAIRRGETDLAIHAARSLHRQRGNGIWRRFLIIAFEDVGIGNLDLVRRVTLANIDRQSRKTFGTDDEAVATFARDLSESPKDRSSDLV